MIDLILYDPNYINVVQSVCPYILRYLTTAVLTNKRRRSVLKDLVKVIQVVCNKRSCYLLVFGFTYFFAFIF